MPGTIPRLARTCAVAALLLPSGCSTPSLQTDPARNVPPAGSVWAVDLVRTLPGAQADYVRSIETNWANSRRLARARGSIRSYRAFVAPPDTGRGWDVLLMTEYSDSAAFERREEIFADIFASPEYVRIEPARPSAEMRDIVIGSVPMRAFVVSPPR